MRLTRRSVLLVALFAAACRRSAAGARRCPHCGMLVAHASPFRADATVGGQRVAFDTPRCAFASLAQGRAAGPIEVREYYTQVVRPAEAVRFVAGSDVEGPMGPELVPVSPDKVEKFLRDHRGARVYNASQVTADVLKKEGAP